MRAATEYVIVKTLEPDAPGRQLGPKSDPRQGYLVALG